MFRGRRRSRWSLTRVVGGLLGSCSVVSSAPAQVLPYQVIEEAAPYVGLGPTAREIVPGLGDQDAAAIPLPFRFTFYGREYDTVYVNANGFVTFGRRWTGQNGPPLDNPDSAGPNGWVAVLWDDLCVSQTECQGVGQPGMGVFYEIDDTRARGRARVEWRRVRHFRDRAQAGDLTFMITLREGVGSVIELSYGHLAAGVDVNQRPTRFGARVGIEDELGAIGRWVGPCRGPTACTTEQVEALQDTRITLLADGGPDVALEQLTVPRRAFVGRPVPISARLLNRHRNPVGPVGVEVLILPPSRTSTTDLCRPRDARSGVTRPVCIP